MDKNGKIKTREEDLMTRWRDYNKSQEYEKRRNTEIEENELTQEKLEIAIQKIKIGKYPGYDTVTAE